MNKVCFSDEELELLKNTLEVCLSDLRMEIAGTDNQEYKKGLHDRKDLIVKMLDKILTAIAVNQPES